LLDQAVADVSIAAQELDGLGVDLHSSVGCGAFAAEDTQVSLEAFPPRRASSDGGAARYVSWWAALDLDGHVGEHDCTPWNGARAHR
jgi:hypothetical protein